MDADEWLHFQYLFLLALASYGRTTQLQHLLPKKRSFPETTEMAKTMLPETAFQPTSWARAAPSGTQMPRRETLRAWIRHHLDNNTFSGVVWLDRQKGLFKIPWLHRAKRGWRKEHGLIFKAWAQHTGNYKDTDTDGLLKTRLRCALAKSYEIDHVKTLSSPVEKDCFRVYRFRPDERRPPRSISPRKGDRVVNEVMCMSEPMQEQSLDLRVPKNDYEECPPPLSIDMSTEAASSDSEIQFFVLVDDPDYISTDDIDDSGSQTTSEPQAVEVGQMETDSGICSDRGDVDSICSSPIALIKTAHIETKVETSSPRGDVDSICSNPIPLIKTAHIDTKVETSSPRGDVDSICSNPIALIKTAHIDTKVETSSPRGDVDSICSNPIPLIKTDHIDTKVETSSPRGDVDSNYSNPISLIRTAHTDTKVEKASTRGPRGYFTAELYYCGRNVASMPCRDGKTLRLMYGRDEGTQRVTERGILKMPRWDHTKCNQNRHHKVIQHTDDKQLPDLFSGLELELEDGNLYATRMCQGRVFYSSALRYFHSISLNKGDRVLIFSANEFDDLLSAIHERRLSEVSSEVFLGFENPWNFCEGDDEMPCVSVKVKSMQAEKDYNMKLMA